jgi:hypothetical protein
MREGARSLVRQSGHAVLLALPACFGILCTGDVHAQLGPIYHDGYLEYRYRDNRSEDGATNQSHLAGWHARASTWIWQPYILQLDGMLGLSRNREASTSSGNKSTDSRLDGTGFDTDIANRNWGFLQQFSPRRGGRLSLDYRSSSSEEIFVDGSRARQKFGHDQWQLSGIKATRRNAFRLLAVSRDLIREGPEQTQDRKYVSLLHRFKPGPTFFIEDTTIWNDERVMLDGTASNRRLLQLNGLSTWRPQTEKPFFLNMRLLARASDSGPEGREIESSTLVLATSANYQISRRFVVSGNVTFNSNDVDDQEDQTSSQQRARVTYRGDTRDLGWAQYSPGGTLQVGNTKADSNGQDRVQDVAASLNHGLSRNVVLSGGSQVQVSVTQSAAAFADTDDMREQSLTHTLFATWSKPRGRAYNLLQLTASDRRLFGDNEDVYQLVSLQGSSRMQINRRRSLNGGLSLQYSSQSVGPSGDQMSDNSSGGYSVNLSYSHRDLFEIRNLRFQSELRLLSRDFDNGDEFDEDITVDSKRSDRVWRNEVNYRIGRLEFRLLADLRDIDNRWASSVFLGVRRYYDNR